MDPDQLADVLAGPDSHLTLDLPLELADALRRLLAARESEIAALRGKLSTAELALLSMTARVERAAAADYVRDEDEAYCAGEGWPHVAMAGAL